MNAQIWCGKLKAHSVRVSLLEPVSYGTFLNLLRGFDAILVPSLSDEQPRPIFDAFSQAVPVLGRTREPYARS